MRRAAAILILVVLTGWPAAAHADAPGRCYPPPCAASAQGDATAATPEPPASAAVVGGATAPEGRSPVPFVATGLVAFTAFLCLVVARRRTNIARRSQVRLAEPGRTVPGTRRERLVNRSADRAPGGVAIR